MLHGRGELAAIKAELRQLQQPRQMVEGLRRRVAALEEFLEQSSEQDRIARADVKLRLDALEVGLAEL